MWGTAVSAPLRHRLPPPLSPCLLPSLSPSILGPCWPEQSWNTPGLWDEGLSHPVFKLKQKVSQNVGRMGGREVMNPICSWLPVSKPFGNAFSRGLWTSPYDLLWPTGQQQTMQAENEKVFAHTLGPALLLVLEPWDYCVSEARLAHWRGRDRRVSHSFHPRLQPENQQTDEWSHPRPPGPHPARQPNSDTWTRPDEVSPADPLTHGK